MKRISPILGAFLALFLVLSGCSSPSTEPFFPDAPVGAQPASGGSERDSAGGSPVAAADRKIARTASITVEVTDAADAAASIRTITGKLDGRVTEERMSQSSKGTWSGSEITVMVPSAKLEEALDSFATLGTLKSRTVTARDVTEAVVDIDSRVATMRESIARLKALMNKAGSLADVAAIERELTERQATLESLLAQQKSLATQVELAPVSITLQVAGESFVAPNPFMRGLESGWQAFLLSISLIITAIGALLPVAVLVAAVVVPIVWWRRRQRAARAKLLADADPGALGGAATPDAAGLEAPDDAPATNADAPRSE